jgi:integrase
MRDVGVSKSLTRSVRLLPVRDAARYLGVSVWQVRGMVHDKLTEADPSSGFFERDQYESVFRHLADDLQVAAAIAHTYGWRTQSEVLTRERRHLDLGEGTLRIDPGETKNKKGRIVYLTPDLKVLLTAQLARVEAIRKQTGRIIPYLFPHLRGRRHGARRKDYRKAWLTACKAAGVAGRHRHDFRRTAVRNMVNSGVVERVAMAVTGTFSGTLGASEASRPR